MTERIFPAKTEALPDVLDFVEQTLEAFQCPQKLQMSLCVAVEEVFVNVAHYAYGGGEGDVTLAMELDDNVVTFRMTDKGILFDPLQKPDPDITLSADQREIGGLGIFIAKRTMDSIHYAYENGENILTMLKKL